MIYVGACYLHSRPVTREYTLLSCSSEELRSKEVLKPAQGQSQSPRAGFARQRSLHSPSVSWTGRCQFGHRLYCIKGYLVSWWGIVSGGLLRGVHLPYRGQSPSRRLEVYLEHWGGRRMNSSSLPDQGCTSFLAFGCQSSVYTETQVFRPRLKSPP